MGSPLCLAPTRSTLWETGEAQIFTEFAHGLRKNFVTGQVLEAQRRFGASETEA